MQLQQTLPLQVRPSPWKPSKHLHMYALSTCLMQLALTSQFGEQKSLRGYILERNLIKRYIQLAL